jgi:NAD(P)-dependent dehydrogenase (short-subunit alcohol dehydrogenase family)
MQLALITGASRGLGLALHHRFQAAGWTVVDFSRAAPHAGSRHTDLAALRPADLPDLLEGLPLAGVRELALVHNAGVVGPIGLVGEGLPPMALQANAHTNFGGALLLLGALVQRYQGLESPRKWLLNISSGAALRPIAGWSAYCAAKAGMEHFIRCVAEEQKSAAWPLRALNLNPGVMDTDMQGDIRASRFPDRELFVQRHAEGLLQDPDRVAERLLRLLQQSPAPAGGERVDLSRD